MSMTQEWIDSPAKVRYTGGRVNDKRLKMMLAQAATAQAKSAVKALALGPPHVFTAAKD